MLGHYFIFCSIQEFYKCLKLLHSHYSIPLRMVGPEEKLTGNIVRVDA